MPHAPSDLQATLKRWTLLLGVLQVTVGCLVGFIPPSAVAWYRGLVMAHIEFTANGVLVIVFGFLATELNLPAMALKAWFVLLQVGAWTNGAAGLVGAFAGSSSPLMPSLNEKFPPPGGADNPIVTGLLQTCGVAIVVALLLTLWGLWRRRPAAA
ncbi:MAG: hypothetical protein KDA44_03425 [Planctomycetales bacterium]|nr:hypothetical protein [Planctomycetales bacterium]